MKENGHKEDGVARMFFGGLLVGAVASAAVSLLYAPRSGAETRAMIKERAVKTRDRMNDMVEKSKARMTEWRERSKEKAREMAAKVEGQM